MAVYDLPPPEDAKEAGTMKVNPLRGNSFFLIMKKPLKLFKVTTVGLWEAAILEIRATS